MWVQGAHLGPCVQRGPEAREQGPWTRGRCQLSWRAGAGRSWTTGGSLHPLPLPAAHRSGWDHAGTQMLPGDPDTWSAGWPHRGCKTICPDAGSARLAGAEGTFKAGLVLRSLDLGPCEQLRTSPFCILLLFVGRVLSPAAGAGTNTTPTNSSGSMHATYAHCLRAAAAPHSGQLEYVQRPGLEIPRLIPPAP